MDPSRILNVPPDADKATITKAFRKMALKYHPDKAGDNSKLKFQHVGVAYEILMAKHEGKATASGTDNHAGMSVEDAAWIKKIRHRQEKKYGSFNFSFDGDPSFVDDEETGLFKECPICCGLCNVKEFLPPAPFDPLDFMSWPTLTPVPLASPAAKGRPTAWPPSTSFPYHPASTRPQPTPSSSAAQGSVPSHTDAEKVNHFLLRFRDSNSNDFFYPDSKVSVLWPYKPRATDEFALGRGEMLRIVSIYDDGWALGYRLGERADEGIGKANKPIFPAWLDPDPAVKAFPLVCVTVPRAWKKCVEQDLKARSGRTVNSARPFVPAFKKLKVWV